jgi:ESS family glutamate:Na+ symporter
MNRLGGSLMELGFGGGHGTIAGLSGLFDEKGAPELVDLGYGLATIGMLSAVIVGTMFVNFAVRSPNIQIARDKPTSPAEDFDIDHHMPGPDDPPLDENRGMTQVTAAAVFLGISIGVGWLLLEALRWIANLFGSDLFDFFPLFPLTIIGGALVQIAAVRFKFTWAVKRRAVEGLGGIATDGLVICSIGTLSLSALSDNLAPLIILTVASVAWSAFVLLGLGRRFYRQHWFEHAITEFGEHQGNVATGYMMLDMVDPGRKTGVVYGYNYRQLITRPIVGGGFLSALSVPFIDSAGLGVFAIVSVTLTVIFAIWGIRRALSVPAGSRP